MEGWHFLSEDRRLQYPPHTLVEPGLTLRVDPPIGLCNRGLHASRRAIDALYYAPGPIVCRVRLGGEIIEGEDKAVATERTVLWMADATQVLHEFACWCAEQALLHEREAGREPDPRLWAAIETKRCWLRGMASDDELDAARDAAWAVAWDMLGAAVAWDMLGAIATWDIPGAAWAAARAASRRTAAAMAWDTAAAAMWNEMAWERMNERLEQMLMALEHAGGG